MNVSTKSYLVCRDDAALLLGVLLEELLALHGEEVAAEGALDHGLLQHVAVVHRHRRRVRRPAVDHQSWSWLELHFLLLAELTQLSVLVFPASQMLVTLIFQVQKTLQKKQ